MQEKDSKSTLPDKQTTNNLSLNFPSFTKEEKDILYSRHLTSFAYLQECIKNIDHYPPLWLEVVRRLEQKILETKPKTIIISGGSRIISRISLEKAFKNIPQPHPTIIELDSQDNYWLYKHQLISQFSSETRTKHFPNDVEQELAKHTLDFPVMYLDDHISKGNKAWAVVIALKGALSRVTRKDVQDSDVAFVNLVSPREHDQALMVDEEIAYFLSALAGGLSDRNDPETITKDNVKSNLTLTDRKVEIKFSHFLKKISHVLRQA